MNRERALAAAASFETPCAVVDLNVVERNLARMAAIAASAGLRLRPHAKTHKSPWLAARQIAHGATGLTVATLREAEVYADAGIDDLLLAHPPVGATKLMRLGRLADRIRQLAVSLDDVGVAQTLPQSIEVLWEVDTGQHRLGTQAGLPTVDAVRRLVAAIGLARFRGLITHAGHSYKAKNSAERREIARAEMRGVVETAELLRQEGIPVREVSVGSTPTAKYAGLMAGVTEMRPGTYAFGDANQVTLGSQRLEDCAFGVVATVVSVPAADRAVLDAGSKALSADLSVAGLKGYGLVVDAPHLTVGRLSEEHAVVTGTPTGLHIGDRVVVIPAHACTTVNLHPALLVVEGDGFGHWQPVAARGWRSPD